MDTNDSKPALEPETQNSSSQYSRPSRNNNFLRLGVPRFRGFKLGIGLGLLVVGLTAGLAELYNLLWNTNSTYYADDTTFLSDAAMVLFVVLTIGLLGLASIALPLLLVWGKGKKRAIVTFGLEFAVIFIALALAMFSLYRSGSLNSDGGYVNPCPSCVNCGVDLNMGADYNCPEAL